VCLRFVDLNYKILFYWQEHETLSESVHCMHDLRHIFSDKKLRFKAQNRLQRVPHLVIVLVYFHEFRLLRYFEFLIKVLLC